MFDPQGRESVEAQWWADFGTVECDVGETTLVTNTISGCLLLMRSIDIANQSGAEGDSCIVFRSASGGPVTQFTRGAGPTDVWPWRGYLGLYVDDGLVANVFAGVWWVSCCGFYIPDYTSHLT